MSKLMTAFLSAAAVVAFSTGARADDEKSAYDARHAEGFWFDENHIDDPEHNSYVFWDDKELEEFIKEMAAEVEAPYKYEAIGQAKTLDLCFTARPIAWAVTTRHLEGTQYEHTHTEVGLRWDSGSSRYYACYNYNQHNYLDVDGIKGWWETLSASDCDYCDWDDWRAKYDPDVGSWSFVTEDEDCYAPSSEDWIVYWGEELDGYNNVDYELGDRMVRFERDGTSTDSEAFLGYCVD